MRKTTKAIIYPLEIRVCKIKNNDHEVNSYAGQLVDFSMLPTKGSMEDCLPPRLSPNVSEDLVSKPFEATSYPLEDGIHLHWSLPRALRTAHIQDPASTAGADGKTEITQSKITYRDAPNRWLIKRRVFLNEKKETIVGTKNSKIIEAIKPEEIPQFAKTFYIESDVLSIGDPDGSNAFPYKVNTHKPGDPLYRYIGKCWDYEKWKTRYSDKVVKKGTENYHKNLHAFGYGEPLFAAYYPECKNVFGFHDDIKVSQADAQIKNEHGGLTLGSDTEKKSILKTDENYEITYHIVGWYDNAFYDPTYLATVASEKLARADVILEDAKPLEKKGDTQAANSRPADYKHTIRQTQNGFDLNWEIDEELAADLFTENSTDSKRDDSKDSIEWSFDGRLLFSRKLAVDWPVDNEEWMYDALIEGKNIFWQSEKDEGFNQTFLNNVNSRLQAEQDLATTTQDLNIATAEQVKKVEALAEAQANIVNTNRQLNAATKSLNTVTNSIVKTEQAMAGTDQQENKLMQQREQILAALNQIGSDQQRIVNDLNKAQQPLEILKHGPLQIINLSAKLNQVNHDMKSMEHNLQNNKGELTKVASRKSAFKTQWLVEKNALEATKKDVQQKESAAKNAAVILAQSNDATAAAQSVFIQAENNLVNAQAIANEHSIENIAQTVQENTVAQDQTIISRIAQLLHQYPGLNIEIFYGGRWLSEKEIGETKNPRQLEIMTEVFTMVVEKDIKKIKENIRKQGVANARVTFLNATERHLIWQKEILQSRTFLAIGAKSNNTPANFDKKESLKTLRNTKIAIGNTPPQAYAALIANLSATGADAQEKNKNIQQKELLLDALQLGLLTQLDEPDLIPRIDNGIHQSSFIPEEGGHFWKIEMLNHEKAMENKLDTEGKKASAETMMAWSKQLKKLNDAQAKFDEARYKIGTAQKALYADWYKFMTAEYNLKLGEITQKTQVNEIRYYLLKQMKKLHDQFLNIEQVAKQIDSAENELNTTLKTWMEHDVDKLRKVYKLEKVLDHRFWSPAEPAILLHGKDIEHSARYHAAKPDVVKIIHVELSADNETLIGELDDSMNYQSSKGKRKEVQKKVSKKNLQSQPWSAVQDGSIDWSAITYSSGLLFETVEANTWDPIYLDWQVKLYPITKPYGQNNEQYPWQEDAVLKNFDLKNGEIDLLLNTDDSDNTKHLIDFFVKKDSTKILQTVDGRSVLTPNAQQSMIQAVKDAWEYNKETIVEIDGTKKSTTNNDGGALINAIEKVKILSQNLSGLNDAFLMQKQILQLAVFDPLADNLVLDELTNNMLKQLIGKANDTAPLPHNLFLPIREGYMRISKLRMVDTFGRINLWNADDHFEDAANAKTLENAPEIILAESFKREKEKYTQHQISETGGQLSSTEAEFQKKNLQENLHAQFLAKSAFLPPRLAQPSRLQLKLHDTTAQLANPAEHTPSAHDLNFNPVCGWFLPNFLDNTLYIYDANGKPLKLIGIFKRKLTDVEIAQRQGQEIILEQDPNDKTAADNTTMDELIERPVPGHNHIQKIENEYLQKAFDFLWKSHHDTTNPVDNFREFITTTFSVLQNVEPKQFSQFTGTALMMGKPLAIIRATVHLEIKGDPATDYNWEKSMQTYLGGTEGLDENLRTTIISQMGFTNVKFPLRLGAVAQANDGLVGYFLLPNLQNNNADNILKTNIDVDLNEFYAPVNTRVLKHTAQEYFTTQATITRLKKEQIFMPDAQLLMPFVKELYKWASQEKKVGQAENTKSDALDAAITKANETEILGKGEPLIAQMSQLTDAAFQFINSAFKNYMGTKKLAALLNNCLKSAYVPMQNDDLLEIKPALFDIQDSLRLLGANPDLSGEDELSRNQIISCMIIAPLVQIILQFGATGGKTEVEEKLKLAYENVLASDKVMDAINDPLMLTDEKYLSHRGKNRLIALFDVFGIRLGINDILSFTTAYFDEKIQLQLTDENRNKIKSEIIGIESKAFLYAPVQFDVNEKEITKLDVVLKIFEKEKQVQEANIYTAPKPESFSLTADGAKKEILMLVDPRARVHVTTGILPIQSIEIPPAAIADAIKNIQMTFLTAPILSPPIIDFANDFLTIPTLNEEDAHWAWLEKMPANVNNEAAKSWQTIDEKNIKRPPEAQLNIPHKLTLREGWLQLRKGQVPIKPNEDEPAETIDPLTF